METNLSKPWYGVWTYERRDRIITNRAGATIAMVPVLFGADDAEHTEKIITGAINRHDDLVDSAHRLLAENARLREALDQCVEALAMFLPPRCQAQYVGSPNFNAGKPCGLCAYCKATAALELAKKARG